MTMTDPCGLYLHIPFCKRKCLYCDFCSFAGRESDMHAYVSALISEMRARPLSGRTVSTVYLGGGTPSLLPNAELARLLEGIHQHYTVDPVAEFTCEVNPCTADLEKFSLLRSLGVNRISMGVQSLSDRALRALGRLHTADDARAAVALLRRAGFENLSLDLMTGLPGETPEELADTVRGILALAPEHISAYALTVEEATPLATSPLRNTIPDEDAAADAMEATADALEAAGYHRYEISNYARKGYESRHNLAYWQGREYLGLGVAAYSYLDGVRFGKPRDLSGYLSGKALPEVDCEVLSDADREAECVMLSLRLAAGIDRAAYRAAYGRDPATLFAAILSRYPDCFRVTPVAVALTPRGMAVSNALIAECLLAIE